MIKVGFELQAINALDPKFNLFDHPTLYLKS